MTTPPWIGIAVGALLFSWTVSGIIMMVPQSSGARAGPRTDAAIDWLAVPVSPARATEVASAAIGGTARRVDSNVSATGGLPEAVVRRVDRIDRAPAGYWGKLPAFRVELDDPRHAVASVAEAMGEVSRTVWRDRVQAQLGHSVPVFTPLKNLPGRDMTRVGTAIVWWTLGGAVGLYVLWTLYLAVVLRWEDEQTVGLGYYGLDQAGRDRFKRWLRLHALLLAPLIAVNSRLTKVDFRRVRVVYKGVSFPSGSCDAASTARAESYIPRPEDVFVVTQMKCGTTWMEHVVYEVLYRGHGNLVETGTALYAVAPWLEGRKSVPVEQAPVLGAERPSRIIKTHLPAQLCPSSPEARYIYVARHPVSCFASCVDFIATNVGAAMAPGMPAYEEWFRSADLMWWGTWPAHVNGWWDRSRRDRNVLFVRFEEMKRDLPEMVRRVAAFLGVAPLSEAELARVVEKCGFDYMQKHQSNFEMHPPHILQTNAELFVRGTAERHKDVPDDTRRRLLGWVAAEMATSDFPLAQAYPDVAATRPGAG